ncbi:U1 small nuclear ribonucleoprotein component SNU71 [Spathaspora sp. JA1]|nr:U1 small nuclear ribonucleoprotein component SNU71 [Spathaspora sp. JA1]
MTKDEIITIAPYSLNSSNGILSLLQRPPPTGETSIALTIPTLSSLDTSTLINLNTTRIHNQQDVTLPTTTTDNINTTTNTEQTQQLTHYVSLSNFTPTSLKDQVNTIILKNISNLPTSLPARLLAIERLLNMCMNIAATPVSYTWSIINHEYLLDLNLVFIRFNNTSDVSWFLSSFDKSFEVIPNEQFTLNENIPKSQVPDSIKSFQHGNTVKDKTDESQEILNYYKSQYKVDNSELVDIPNSMKESTIVNILKFRSQVLIMEKENRKRDLERERLKTRDKLKSLFEEKRVEQQVESSKEYTPRDEFEDMDEEEYREYLEFKQRETLDKQYSDSLVKMKQKETHKSQLLNQLEQVSNYEDSLIDNKLKHIDDVKQDNTHHIYYTNYNHYLKLRNSKRTIEQTNDELDRKEEHAQKVPKRETQPEQLPDEPNVQINLDHLQPKIIELVKEYLGIQDDFLIEVINEHLSTHGLTHKSNLVEELTQVLDEDAVSLIDDLWEYAKTTK